MNITVLLTATLLASAAASGQVQQHAGHSLGTVHFPISCSKPAQLEFDRAITLLHHMTYPQAREAFEEVAAGETLAIELERRGSHAVITDVH